MTASGQFSWTRDEAVRTVEDYLAERQEIETAEGWDAAYEFVNSTALMIRPEGSSFLYWLLYSPGENWMAVQQLEPGECWPADLEQEHTELGPVTMSARDLVDILFVWAATHPPLE